MDTGNASHHVKTNNNNGEEMMMMAADCEDEVGNDTENRRRPPRHDHLQPPTSPIGRTFSASAVDFGWKRKKQDSADSDQQHQPSTPNRLSLAGMKRKYSAQQEYSSNSSSSNSNSPCRLPQFVGCPIPSDLAPLKAMTAEQHNPSPSNSAEFITPTQPKKQSRPNSPSSAGSRLILPRSRVASIRRESDCGSEKRFGDAEAAHEKLVKSAQQVSLGFEDFCLDDKLFEERKRTKSLTEPISIFTNAFLPQTSSPSPSRAQMDAQKQCYSPSAQQVVKANLAYSPSPSPTPASSPSMHRMRSMSPIAVRQIAKRRYTGSSSNFGNSGGSGLESDGEGGVSSSFSLSAPLPKRQCTISSVLARNNANSSPLVRDSTPDLLPLQNQHHPLHPVPSSSSSISELFAASSPVYSAVSSSSSLNNSGFGGPVMHSSSRFLVDPNLTQCFPPYSSHSFDGQEEEEEDERREGSSQLMSSFCSSSLFNDANSSTTFSSRANTPESASQFGAENSDMPPTTTLLPPRANSSSDCGSSSRSSYSFQQQQQQNQNTGTGFGLLPESSSSSSNNNNNNCGEDEAKTDPNNGE